MKKLTLLFLGLSMLLLLAQCKKEQHRPATLIGEWEGEIYTESNFFDVFIGVRYASTLTLREDSTGTLAWRQLGASLEPSGTELLLVSTRLEQLQVEQLDTSAVPRSGMFGLFNILVLSEDSLVAERRLIGQDSLGNTVQVAFASWKFGKK